MGWWTPHKQLRSRSGSSTCISSVQPLRPVCCCSHHQRPAPRCSNIQGPASILQPPVSLRAPPLCLHTYIHTTCAFAPDTTPPLTTHPTCPTDRPTDPSLPRPTLSICLSSPPPISIHLRPRTNRLARAPSLTPPLGCPRTAMIATN